MTRDLLRQLEALIRPLKVRIANSIARAVVQVVDDDKKMQLLQVGVLADEDVDDAERFEQYGFKSVPFPGAEAVIVFPNGDRAHGIIVAVGDRRHRPTGWEPGEVGMFTDQAGNTYRLRRDGIQTIEATATIELGAIGASHPAVLGDTFKTAYDAHLHPTPMGPSGPPSPLLPPAVLSTKTKLDV